MLTVPTDTSEVIDLLRRAAPEELFSSPDPRHTYRLLARRCHPDAAPEHLREDAAEAFALLTRLWTEFTHAGRTLLSTSERTYALEGVLAQGDLATLYTASYSTSALDHQVVVKLARSVRNNDLLEREVRALSTLSSLDERYASYFPALLDTLRHQDPSSKEERRANVLEPLEGFYTLTQVQAVYPDLDPRDAAWMLRRLLVALGLTHRAGLVHGGVTPDHVLVHPQMHGLVLVGWSCATLAGKEHLPARVSRHAGLYPPEVATRSLTTPSLDLYMAARLAHDLVPSLPPELHAVFTPFTRRSPADRPQDAWRVLADLDRTLEDLYGPRRFRPFSMP